ncbi:MAG: hypothetical protein ACLVME_05740 [Ezakiella coagulans]|uniref:hypothetical protein n=1 Tax=Ezakiella coagulans TaxID=46507 RepID=UPI003999E9E8
MENTVIIFLFFLIIFVGAIALQVFLSKRESKFLGLILPIISVLNSLIIVLNIAGDAITKTQILIALVSAFLIGNIPTIILMAIYFGVREKMKIESELDKTRIKDL